MMNTQNYYKTIASIRPRLLRKAIQNTTCTDDAEDLVQEVLIRLWMARDKWENYNNWEAVAMQTLKNCLIDNFRKKHIFNVPLEECDNSTQTQNPLQTLESKDINFTITEIINQLPNLQRLIIRMKDIEGYEIDEIATITQTSPDSIRMNLSRARKKVRDTYMKIK